MEKYEAYNIILDLVLRHGNTTAKNVLHDFPDFPEKDEARIDLMLEDMNRMAPKSFNLKHANRTPVLIKTAYTHMIKEDGGFQPYFDVKVVEQPIQKHVFQKADGTNPLKDLHPRVQEVAGDLFTDGYFKSAILETYIALNVAVKEKTGSTLDGTKLMQNVFSGNNPQLVVSDDSDERQGFMWLFTGAIMAIRNPKAHRIIEQKDPQRTLEWLSFASVLFRVLDEAQLPEPDKST